MWLEPYLLSMATLTLTALGLAVLIITLALDKLVDGTNTVFPDKPTLQGAWFTVINFFSILIFSIAPILINSVYQELQVVLQENGLWRILSGIAVIYFCIGFIKMQEQYRKRYTKGNFTQNREIKNYMRLGFYLILLFIAMNTLNAILGLGSLYIIALSFHFLGILIWMGLIMYYAQLGFQKKNK
jgi:hypothetical protein